MIVSVRILKSGLVVKALVIGNAFSIFSPTTKELIGDYHIDDKRFKVIRSWPARNRQSRLINRAA